MAQESGRLLGTLEAQHDLLNRLLEQVSCSLADGRADLSRLRDKLGRQIRHHFAAEETAVFPVLLAASAGAARESIEFLRDEHGEILLALQAFEAEPIASGRAKSKFAHFERALSQHQARERRVLYPLTSELCPPPLERVVRAKLEMPERLG